MDEFLDLLLLMPTFRVFGFLAFPATENKAARAVDLSVVSFIVCDLGRVSGMELEWISKSLFLFAEPVLGMDAVLGVALAGCCLPSATVGIFFGCSAPIPEKPNCCKILSNLVFDPSSWAMDAVMQNRSKQTWNKSAEIIKNK